MVRTRLAASDLSDGSTASHFKSFYLGVLGIKTIALSARLWRGEGMSGVAIGEAGTV
jgi:hypothetical protein